MTKTIALPKEIMRRASRRIAELSEAEGERISFSRYTRRLINQDIKESQGRRAGRAAN